MYGPVVFLSRSRIKPGKEQEYRRLVADAVHLVSEHEPRVLGFLFYDDGGPEVSTLQVHPDAASLDAHLRLWSEHLARRALDCLDIEEVQVLGEASPDALAVFDTVPGLRVTLMPHRSDGFLRVPAHA